MEITFSILAIFLLAQSCAALFTGLRQARYNWRERTQQREKYVPKTAVIIPCKGLDPDFTENIVAYLAQDYRHYELYFVTENEADPAHQTIKRILQESNRTAWLLTAGEAQNRGQKVHNLCSALDTLDAFDRKAEILVFADADACPAPNWLQELVSPLADRRIGATTGFRWYVATTKNFWAQFLSVWNASALSLLGERSAFAWGGAMAINRDFFESLRIKERWEAGAVSDDYILTSAVHTEGLRIKFVPPCLMASKATVTWRSLWEFTTRQMKITRVYAPRVWWLGIITNTIFNLAFWGSLSAWLSGTIHTGITIPCVFISYLLGLLTGGLRAFVASKLLPAEITVAVQKNLWAYIFLHPFVALLYLGNVLASVRDRKIIWRGIGYEMLSSSETKIWQRPAITFPQSATETPAQRQGAAAKTSSTLDS